MRIHKHYIVALGVAVIALTSTQLVFGHVTVAPRESVAGTEQDYSMRVPTERDTPTVQVEIEFPAEVEVLEVAPRDGWQIDENRNADGRIVGAVWTGGSIPPGEAQEFQFRVRNPTEATPLVWRASQVQEDGSRAEWFGESGSRTPAPVTRVMAGR